MFEIIDLREAQNRKAFYEWLDKLASSDAFDACEVTLKLQVIHEPARGAKADADRELGRDEEMERAAH